MSIHPGRGLAYYNEVEPFAVAWLRELMAEGLIAPGVIDERPIQEVQPSDVEPYTQAHFFAGIGVWSYALRSAGWDDSWPVWTGSCPCQPFSSAGKRLGSEDERHLWPEWFRLIRESRPDVLFGEQVSSEDGLVWFDSVSADLEPEDYALGAMDTCAAGVGAPHHRQRLYFVAESLRQRGRLPVQQRGPRFDLTEAVGGCEVGALANATEARPARGAHAGADGREEGQGQGQGYQPSRRGEPSRGSTTGSVAHAERGRRGARLAGGPDWRPTIEPDRHSAALPLGDTSRAGRAGRAGERGDDGEEQPSAERGGRAARTVGDTGSARSGRDAGAIPGAEGEGEGREPGRVADVIVAPGVTRGFWGGAVFIRCRDGKWRAAQPGIFPLATRTPGRVGLLRGAGNSLVSPQAQAFIEAYLDVVAEREATS